MRLRPVPVLWVTLFIPLVAFAANPDILVWSENAMTKVRPYDSPKATPSSISISAAINEFESFQVVIRAHAGPLRDVDVDISDFRSGQGERIPCRNNCTIYRELYITINEPSGSFGSTGEWPDVLIPKVDRYFGERRNAFPFDVAEGRNQPIWVDVYIPREALPGFYTGDLMVQARGERILHIPIHLTVWGFTLPGTSSLNTTFSVSPPDLAREHGSSMSDRRLDELMKLYTASLLKHRLSNSVVFGCCGWIPWQLVQSDNHSLGDFQEEWGRFFEGSLLPSGGRLTAVTIEHRDCLEGPLCREDFLGFFASSGWLDRLFVYLPDEPNLADPNVVQEVIAIASSVHERDPRLRTKLTVFRYWEPVQPYVDLWVVSVPAMHQAFEDGSYWSTWKQEMELGKEVWVYQACFMHNNQSCGYRFPVPPDWPDYMIDMQGIKNRIQDWVNWKFGVQGEMYWCTNCWEYLPGDPFEVQLAPWGGNGDTGFFYPGTPDRIGGTTHIPIESLRLKLKREGLEDYEYLALLARNGQKAFADGKATELVKSAMEWEHDPAVLYRVRSEMAAQLEILHDFMVEASPTRRTVSRGQSATYQVVVKPEFGAFYGSVVLSCSNMPSMISCSFTPATVTPGTGQATSILTVATPAYGVLLAPPGRNRQSQPAYALWLGAAGLSFLGMTLVTRQTRRKLRLGLPVGALASLLLLEVACGGCAVSPFPVSQESSGTSHAITVTAISGSLQRSRTVTLVIQ